MKPSNKASQDVRGDFVMQPKLPPYEVKFMHSKRSTNVQHIFAEPLNKALDLLNISRITGRDEAPSEVYLFQFIQQWGGIESQHLFRALQEGEDIESVFALAVLAYSDIEWRKQTLPEFATDSNIWRRCKVLPIVWTTTRRK